MGRNLLIDALVVCSAVLANPRLNSRNVLELICREASHDSFLVRVADLRGPSRDSHTVVFRDVAYYVFRDKFRLSYPEIGRYFRKDHSTVITGYRKIERAYAEHRTEVNHILSGRGVRADDDASANSQGLSNISVREQELINALVVYRRLLAEDGITIENVVERVAEEAGVSVADVQSRNGYRSLYLRWVGSYLVTDHLGGTPDDSSRIFSYQTEESVRSARKRFKLALDIYRTPVETALREYVTSDN